MILTFSLPLMHIRVNISTLYNDTLVVKELKPLFLKSVNGQNIVIYKLLACSFTQTLLAGMFWEHLLRFILCFTA